MATLRVLPEAQVLSHFGNPTHKITPGLFPLDDRVAVNPEWARTSLMRVDLPQLDHVHPGAITVHRRIVPALIQAFDEIDQRGCRTLIKSWGGSYVPRYMRGGTQTLSRHTWGIAFDINVAWNGYNQTPTPITEAGSVRALVPIFAEYGFAWGGHFKNHPDGMHFEFADLSCIGPESGWVPEPRYRLLLDGKKKPTLLISTNSQGTLVTPCGPLSALLGHPCDPAEKDTLIPIRVYAHALGYAVQYFPEGNGGYVNLITTGNVT